MSGFHADHVGSLLRPKSLLDARTLRDKGHISSEQLATAEDQAILHALRLQKEAGVDVFTDGEFRRSSWVSGLYDAAAEGVAEGEDPRPPDMWRGPGAAGANADQSKLGRTVTGRLKLRGRLTQRETPFLGRYAPGPFKVAMPGPSVHMDLYRQGRSEAAYPTRRAFLEELVGLYQSEVRAQAADGAAYIQLDSSRYADAISGAPPAAPGVSAKEALEEAIWSDNAVLTAARSAGAVAALHICRGNSARAAAGGYEPVAERLLSEVEADRFLLEFDDDGSGGFEPLRFAPKGRTIVLGLVATRRPELEDKDMLRRRVDEAAKYVDLQDLALSPQCGFASTCRGASLSESDEKRKLELVAETARLIWG
jgi:5-methyltetrahydropteroyltriglutamate--homocysteine methyltransferase